MNANPTNGMDYRWGPDKGGLQLGLHAGGVRIQLGHAFEWFWALRATDGAPHEVTLRHVDDPRFRCRLQVFKGQDQEPLWEFMPAMAPGRQYSGERVVVLADPITDAGDGEATFDPAWGAGTYRLQLVFGGSPFRFALRSGEIEITAGEGSAS
ncbi:hypothetical protein HEP74_04005 [Xanthomonas sp. SS]|uniref:hypothetical protein n=1 Tax=Xanthomonas sp. SS TaxID=2724122 RepID=UPI001639C453|nr:hypothetical protein [Xanthomonas sp. SS]QNH18829.1 hypothetical protein HEP74_04005 [Xanthomonas sp. SS]